MSEQAFEQWKESLDAKQGDKIVTDFGELECLERSISGIVWQAMGVSKYYVARAATRASFWRKIDSGLSIPVNQKVGEVIAEVYECLSVWGGSGDSEVEKLARDQPGKYTTDVFVRKFAAAIKTDIMKELKR